MIAKIFAANFKLNKNPTEMKSYFIELAGLINQLGTEDKKYFDQQKCLFFPSANNLGVVSEVLLNHPFGFQWGPQNFYFKSEGAFTGEISAKVSEQMGAKVLLLGHSERRSLFFEDSHLLKLKLEFALSTSCKVVYCIGETLEQRNKNQTEQILKEQLNQVLNKQMDLNKIIIAYEPVWAIGTGQTATAEQVDKVHHFLKMFIQQQFNSHLPILYGGSVKPESSKELLSIAHVDGFLIGGACLDPKSFFKIILNR